MHIRVVSGNTIDCTLLIELLQASVAVQVLRISDVFPTADIVSEYVMVKVVQSLAVAFPVLAGVGGVEHSSEAFAGTAKIGAEILIQDYSTNLTSVIQDINSLICNGCSQT